MHLNFEKYATKAFSYECFLLLFTSFPSLRILKKKKCMSDPSFCDAFMHECNQFDCNKRQIRYEISPIIPKLLLSTITHHPSSQNAHPKKASQEFRTDDHFAASPIQNDSINLSNALSAKLSTSFCYFKHSNNRYCDIIIMAHGIQFHYANIKLSQFCSNDCDNEQLRCTNAKCIYLWHMK